MAMECDEFLEGYSEWVDGRLGEPGSGSFEAHLETCESCARYHRVVQRGLFIYRNLPELRSSPDFLPRLRHRLYHVDDEARLGGRTPLGSAALVAVAAVGVLALAWLPFATRLSVEVALPPVAVDAPSDGPAPSLFSGGPFIEPAVGYVVPAAGWGYAADGPGWSYRTADAAWRSTPAADAFFRGTAIGPTGSASFLNAPPAR
ncbi:MAG: zf-HC2 domain-containing protein [Gemmatimonadota bacterium]